MTNILLRNAVKIRLEFVSYKMGLLRQNSDSSYTAFLMSDYRCILLDYITVFFLLYLGINHENNIRKMRFLTFLSITSQQNEIEYSSLAKQLDLNEDDIEEFVIDGKYSSFLSNLH